MGTTPRRTWPNYHAIKESGEGYAALDYYMQGYSLCTREYALHYCVEDLAEFPDHREQILYIFMNNYNAEMERKKAGKIVR